MCSKRSSVNPHINTFGIAHRRGCKDGILAVEKGGREREVPVVVDNRQIDKTQSYVVDEVFSSSAPLASEDAIPAATSRGWFIPNPKCLPNGLPLCTS